MAGINAGNLMINGVSAQALSEAAATAQAAAPGNAVTIPSDSMRISKASQAQDTEASDLGESEAVKQLRQLIKDLQKQLAEEQKQLAALMASNMEDTAKAAAVAAKQASIANLSGQILAASGQLLQLLKDSGSSSAGATFSAEA